MSAPLLDRLTLTEARLRDMARGLKLGLGIPLAILGVVLTLAGLALLVGGIASDQKYWVRNDIPRSASLRPPEILVVPGGGALRFRF